MPGEYCCEYNTVTNEVCQSNFPDWNTNPVYPQSGLRTTTPKPTTTTTLPPDPERRVTEPPALRVKRAIGPETDCTNCRSVSPTDARPTAAADFRMALKWFLDDSPGEFCPQAGKVAQASNKMSTNKSLV